MGTIRSGLLEKAEFGKFQKENQDAAALLQREKKDLRVRRKLKEAQSRAEQVKVKFRDKFPVGSDEHLQRLREAKITVGNQVNPIRATYRYSSAVGRKYPAEISVQGLFSTKEHPQDGVPWYGRRYPDFKNQVFKPSQLKNVLEIVKKRFPKATQVFGDRISGSRGSAAARTFSSANTIQKIPLTQKLLKGKKLGLLGLGLSLGEAIRAGKAAYDKNEGKM